MEKRCELLVFEDNKLARNENPIIKSLQEEGRLMMRWCLEKHFEIGRAMLIAICAALILACTRATTHVFGENGIVQTLDGWFMNYIWFVNNFNLMEVCTWQPNKLAKIVLRFRYMHPIGPSSTSPCQQISLKILPLTPVREWLFQRFPKTTCSYGSLWKHSSPPASLHWIH